MKMCALATRENKRTSAIEAVTNFLHMNLYRVVATLQHVAATLVHYFVLKNFTQEIRSWTAVQFLTGSHQSPCSVWPPHLMNASSLATSAKNQSYPRIEAMKQFLACTFEFTMLRVSSTLSCSGIFRM